MRRHPLPIPPPLSRERGRSRNRVPARGGGIGRGCRRICAFLALFLAPILAVAAPAVIDTIPSPGGRLLVPVTLDGRPTIFEIDTGTDLSLLSPDMAAALKLRPAEARKPLIGGADGEPLGTYVTAHSLVVGGMRRGPTFLVMPPRWSVIDARATGMLGGDVLSGWDLELDLPHGKVALHPPLRCCAAPAGWAGKSRAVPVIRRDGHVTVAATLDGKSLQALIDTGATNTSLPIDTARSLFGLAPGDAGVASAAMTITTNGGQLATYRTRFRALEVGGARFPDLQVDLVGRVANPHVATDYALVLGLSELRQMHLYIAYGQRMLYIASE